MLVASNKECAELLLQNGADPFAKVNGEKPALGVAIELERDGVVQVIAERQLPRNDPSTLEWLTNELPNLSSRTSGIQQVFVKKGMEMEEREWPVSRHNLMIMACSCGCEEAVSRLLDTQSVNVPNDENVTPLAAACRAGSAAVTERLLQQGADPNQKSTTYPPTTGSTLRWFQRRICGQGAVGKGRQNGRYR